jgi:hypothetical protein
MPATYYDFTAGPVQFFALDTALSGRESDALNASEQASWNQEVSWLKQELGTAAAAKWRIAYGHRPIYSTGFHGDTGFLSTQGSLMDVVAGRVQIFFGGHDHNIQDLGSGLGLRVFVSGGGGAPGQPGLRRTSLASEPGCYYDGQGFADLIADQDSLTVNLLKVVGERAEVIHTATYRNGRWNTTGPCLARGQ